MGEPHAPPSTAWGRHARPAAAPPGPSLAPPPPPPLPVPAARSAASRSSARHDLHQVTCDPAVELRVGSGGRVQAVPRVTPASAPQPARDEAPLDLAPLPEPSPAAASFEPSRRRTRRLAARERRSDRLSGYGSGPVVHLAGAGLPTRRTARRRRRAS